MTAATAPLVFALPARLTHELAAGCCEAFARTLAPAGQGIGVQVQAQALQQFDSSALAVLLAVCRTAAQQSLALQIIGLPKRAVQLATLYGVSEILAGHRSLTPSP